jgi:Kef-type K+ transport system membrane component KefB
LVVLPVVATLAVVMFGRSFVAAATAAPSLLPSVAAERVILRLPLFLGQVIVIVGVAMLLGRVLKVMGQPTVIGEMLAGLILGRSVLGLVSPATYGWLFPVGTVRFLNVPSQFGIVLFMFLVGLEMDRSDTSGASGSVATIAHASIAVPMLGGALLALRLFAQYATTTVSFGAFALFLGCALGVTAFPVLARILRERGLSATQFGQTALSCAAFADVTAWIVLAIALAAARKTESSVSLVITVLGSVGFVAIMLGVARPIFEGSWRRRSWAGADPLQDRQGLFALILLLVLAAALVAELLGIHALFGAFLAGLVIPKDAALRQALRARFEDLLSVLLLPLFFAYAGIRVDVSGLSLGDLGNLALIIVVAVAGKIGGTTLAARAGGSEWREGAALGVLMNARGLIELVLLTVGLQAGVITPNLFTMMVLMAIGTTMMTTPLLRQVLPTKLAV